MKQGAGDRCSFCGGSAGRWHAVYAPTEGCICLPCLAAVSSGAGGFSSREAGTLCSFCLRPRRKLWGPPGGEGHASICTECVREYTEFAAAIAVRIAR